MICIDCMSKTVSVVGANCFKKYTITNIYQEREREREVERNKITHKKFVSLFSLVKVVYNI